MKLGDFVEKLINVITFGQGKKAATKVAKLRGKEDCGCNRRKEKLNNLPSPFIVTKTKTNKK